MRIIDAFVWPHRIRCRGTAGSGCGALLEVHEEDLYLTDPNYCCGAQVVFECLNCNTRNYIEDLPETKGLQLPSKVQSAEEFRVRHATRNMSRLAQGRP